MNTPLRRTALVLLAGFAILVLAVTYVQVIAGPDYRDDPRNLRVVAWRTGRERGAIVTSDATVAARSDPDPADNRVFVRTYPEAEEYAHVVGYSTVLFGTAGLERTRSEDLVSNRGSTISGVLNAMLGGDLRPRGLRLTFDHGLQEVAATALGEQRGAVVALDPQTGAVLAMVSSPSFDPNDLVGIDAAPAGQALDEDETEPLANRAIQRSYPPGSTFKVVTTAAALETGVASPGTPFPDPLELELPGTAATIRNFDRRKCGDGDTVILAQAFTRSCNTVFARLGMDVGADRLVSTARQFGFDDDIPFDLEVARSRIPPAASLANDPPVVAQSAIGQRDVQATPLQMALMAGSVANGGATMVPYVVADVFTSDGEILESTPPTVWRRAVSPATAAVLTEMMERVVTSGTGSQAAVPGVRIAGKTGTAEVGDGPPHVWFVGFGPVGAAPGEPQIALAVLVESGGDSPEGATGGSVAAPIAQRVFREFFGIPE